MSRVASMSFLVASKCHKQVFKGDLSKMKFTVLLLLFWYTRTCCEASPCVKRNETVRAAVNSSEALTLRFGFNVSELFEVNPNNQFGDSAPTLNNNENALVNKAILKFTLEANLEPPAIDESLCQFDLEDFLSDMKTCLMNFGVQIELCECYLSVEWVVPQDPGKRSEDCCCLSFSDETFMIRKEEDMFYDALNLIPTIAIIYLAYSDDLSSESGGKVSIV